jgi:hypothetical protein
MIGLYVKSSWSWQNILKYRVIFLLVALFLAPLVQAAEVVTTRQVQIEQNFSYAPYLGSGFYGSRSDERSIFVLNVPLSFDLVPTQQESLDTGEFDWGLKFNTTVSAGFFDYDPEVSLPELELPSEIGTLAILPGLEFVAPVNDSWSLHPFVDLGLGKNFEADTVNLIYGFGIRSYFDFSIGDYPFLLGNRLYQAGFKNKTLDSSNSFAAFETGLNMTLLRGSLFGRDTDLGLYYMNFIFSEDLNLTEISEKVDTVDIQNEIGFTFGASRAVSHTAIGRPRIGLGVRFVGNDQLYRLVFGFPFF